MIAEDDINILKDSNLNQNCSVYLMFALPPVICIPIKRSMYCLTNQNYLVQNLKHFLLSLMNW